MNNHRVAWLYPAIPFGAYWQPIINSFQKKCPKAIFFTGQVWPGFISDAPENKSFSIIGESKFISPNQDIDGYKRGFIIASPWVVFPLLRFRPHLIFASAFSIWTILALLLKPVGRWKVIIIYDGSINSMDFQDTWRHNIRKSMARLADGFVANSHAAAHYLRESLQVNESNLFIKTYLVPDILTLLNKSSDDKIQTDNTETSECSEEDRAIIPTVFLFVGQIIDRKGIKCLIDACAILQEKGCSNYSVLVIGEGSEREKYERLTETLGVSEKICWQGWVEYKHLGQYFQKSDVFIFPTYEDVWGMAVLEAMAFGKPVICSSGANASQLIRPSENGYIFDPHSPEALASKMQSFVDDQALIKRMGHSAKQIMHSYTPQIAAESFSEITIIMLGSHS